MTSCKQIAVDCILSRAIPLRAWPWPLCNFIVLCCPSNRDSRALPGSIISSFSSPSWFLSYVLPLCFSIIFSPLFSSIYFSFCFLFPMSILRVTLLLFFFQSFLIGMFVFSMGCLISWSSSHQDTSVHLFLWILFFLQWLPQSCLCTSVSLSRLHLCSIGLQSYLYC